MNSDESILNSNFFTGVCESRNDPLKLGRVKVRIFGLHTDNLEVLSADDLPWASILVPATQSGSAGQGISRSGIPTGTWVFGLFLDGESKQQPLILGSIQGKSFQPETSKNAFGVPLETGFFQEERDLGVDLTKGFFDTQETHLSGNPNPSYSHFSESEHNRLARGEKISLTQEGRKDKDRQKGIRIALDRMSPSSKASSWDEPKTKRQTVYPYNTVSESEGGSISEVDDTPYHERIQKIFGPGHSYQEWGLQGTGYEYKKTWGDSFTVKYSPQEKTFVHGRVDINRDGEHSEISTKSKTEEVFNKETRTIYDSEKLRILGSLNSLVGKDYLLMVNNDVRITASNKMDLDVGSTYRQSFHDVHHSAYWMRQYSWNEGQIHSLRKRKVLEKNNESFHSIVIDNRRDIVSNGDQDSTVSKNFKHWVGADEKNGGNYSLTVNGLRYEDVKKDVHELFEENHIQSILKSRDTSVGENWKRVIIGNDEEKIGKNNRILVRGKREIGVEESQILKVGIDHKREILGKDEEKIQKDKVLHVEQWFYQKISYMASKIGLLWNQFNTHFIVGVIEQAYIKKKQHLLEELAVHVLQTISVKGVGKCNIEIGGDMAVVVKGKLMIRGDQGISISSGAKLSMGSLTQMNIGSSSALNIAAPNAIITKDDIVPVTSKSAFAPPTVTATITDLLGLKNLSPPKIPEIEIEMDTELDVEQPEEPTLPDFPDKPEMGEFVNNRDTWAKDVLSNDD